MIFIREKFLEILKQNGLSQKDFCDRAGVSTSTLKRVLTQGLVPASPYKDRIINAYKRLDNFGLNALNYHLKENGD